MTTLPEIPLPSTIRSRYVDNINGLRMHVLEAGFETHGRPCVLLLHGFPELAFSWRKVMPVLAEAGYHVIAPDQRGYGRTTGWDPDYDGDLASFRLTNLVRDALGLVSAFGYRSVDAVIGHDFGSSVAAWCALIRPDVFRSVVMMSAPFGGPPSLPFNTVHEPAKPVDDPIHRDLAALPRPRKHYQWYYSTREANDDMHRAPQGVHDFLRAYYHHKSADWKANTALPAEIMDGRAKSQNCRPTTSWTSPRTWPPPSRKKCRRPPRSPPTHGCRTASLAFYSAEYQRNGFQGGLQWYRCGTSGAFTPELQTWSGRTIDVPSAFISGKQDWGTYQRPGVYEAMQKACTA